MKIGQARFVTSAPSLAEAPDLQGIPELALVGRSNVGKSSFINCVLGRKRLAHTSNTPGKTRLLNFYEVDGRWVFVDLPGYGYAKVSKSLQQQWQRNFEHFLVHREPLSGIFQLVDGRHDPQAKDVEMYRWLVAQERQPVVVVTKLDKLGKNKQKSALSRMRPGFPGAKIMGFSSATGEGRDKILELIGELLG